LGKKEGRKKEEGKKQKRARSRERGAVFSFHSKVDLAIAKLAKAIVKIRNFDKTTPNGMEETPWRNRMKHCRFNRIRRLPTHCAILRPDFTIFPSG